MSIHIFLLRLLRRLFLIRTRACAEKKNPEGEQDKSELTVVPDPFEDQQEKEITQDQENAALVTPLMSGRDSSNVVATNKPNHEDKSSERGGRNFDCQTTTAEVVEISTETREVEMEQVSRGSTITVEGKVKKKWQEIISSRRNVSLKA